MGEYVYLTVLVARCALAMREHQYAKKAAHAAGVTVTAMLHNVRRAEELLAVKLFKRHPHQAWLIHTGPREDSAWRRIELAGARGEQALPVRTVSYNRTKRLTPRLVDAMIAMRSHMNSEDAAIAVDSNPNQINAAINDAEHILRVRMFDRYRGRRGNWRHIDSEATREAWKVIEARWVELNAPVVQVMREGLRELAASGELPALLRGSTPAPGSDTEQ